MLERGADRGGTGVPQFQCAAGVLVHENTLDGDDIRPELGDDLADGREYLPQPVCEGAVRAPDRAARNIGRPITDKIEDAEPGQA